MSANLASTSSLVIPRIDPYRKTFSRPVSSGWNPMPTSSRLPTRPRRRTSPSDGAVIRARALAQVSPETWLLDPEVAYLSSDQPVTSPFATCFEVLDVLDAGEKSLRAWVRDHQVGTLEIKKTVPKFVDNGMDSMQAVSSFFIVVPELASLDAVFEKQKEIYGDRASSLYHYYGFDLNLPEEMQITLREDIAESVSRMQLEDPQFPAASIQAVAQKRADFYALYGGLLFLGVLLGIVFILGAVLIMYYKQISEGYEDQARFDIMQKVGMTRREIRKSINSQVLTVFFLPLAAAGVHITFAFPMISKLMALFSLTNTSLLAAVTVGCYLVFTLFYVLVYVFTSRAYYSIVSGGVER